jgi:alkylated DNA repair dioxygenase AlkB
MKPGTIIASVSLGTTRVMTFENKSGLHAIPLVSGSLCLIMPPTNDKWSHSIALDKRCQGGRISIIFRYYE